MSLFKAVAAQDAAALAQALRFSRDLNEVGPGRTTPLIEAARSGWLAGVEALLAAGAEPDWKDDEQETALLKAAAGGHVEVARVLLPRASEDERDLAGAFLNAHGASHDPDFHYDESRLKQRAVELAARAADLVGHEDPLKRVERADRAKKNRR